MRHRYLVSLAALLGTLALVLITPFPIAGQNSATTKPGAAPRTPWGDPDLQGVWHVTAGVPLERPEQYAGREFLTDKEVEELDRQKAGNQGRNTRSANAAQDVGGAYNAVFNSILKTGKRTSMIIDPPDGRIPPLTAEAQKRQGGRGGQGRGGGGGQGARGGGQGAGRGQAAQAQGGGNQGGQADNPEAIGSTRCLGVQTPFLPLNTAFAQGTVMRLVQSPKSVAIYMEDDHAGGGVRTIALDGSPHLPRTVRSYLGDSRGRWNGNTLVVETTNFLRPFRGSDVETFKMTERFTRVDANNLRREVTFEDARTWTRPWTVLVELGRFDDSKHMIFDSACHEGNYGMTGILVGARMEEKARAK